MLKLSIAARVSMFDISDPETVLGEAGVEKLAQLSDFSYSFEKIIKILCAIPASFDAHAGWVSLAV